MLVPSASAQKQMLFKFVFKARGRLSGNPVGMDDDLTHLQQQRKTAAWPASKCATAHGVRTQWRAEKLFIFDGERLVQHKVLSLETGGQQGVLSFVLWPVGELLVPRLQQLCCHDIVCLTESDQPVKFPSYSCHSAFQSPPTIDRTAGCLSVYMSDRLHEHVDFAFWCIAILGMLAAMYLFQVLKTPAIYVSG